MCVLILQLTTALLFSEVHVTHVRTLTHTHTHTHTRTHTCTQEQFTEQLYDEKSDLWSLGCLMYELCALSPPFTAPNQRLLAIKVKEAKMKSIPLHFSAHLQQSISILLNAVVKNY